jgi:hypothetical protein
VTPSGGSTTRTAPSTSLRAAKLLIARLYGEGPRRSYFSGCSDGGREGLLAARLYPENFDGIVAGAPAMDWTALNTFHHAWTVQRNRRADGSTALTAERMAVLNRLVVAACADRDAVRSRRRGAMGEEPIMDVAHLGHLELLTPNPEKSLRFFVDVLGTPSGTSARPAPIQVAACRRTRPAPRRRSTTARARPAASA